MASLGGTLRAAGAGVWLGFVSAALIAGIASAASAQSSGADKSQYSLFNPTPESALRNFSPDRPTKGTGPTTIDAGHVEYELDLFNYSYQKTGSVRTTTWVGPNPTLRIGLTNWVELALNIAPFVHVDTEDGATGISSSASGAGDLFVRAKVNLWGNDGGTTAFALIPFVKIPTAPNDIGNGATEGGVIAPLSINLGNDVTLALESEVDALRDDMGSGYHAAYVSLIALTIPIVKDVSFTGELWSSINTEPGGTIRQYSFDVAVAWVVRPNVQLDAGANFGLNRDTPDLQLYAGLAQRF